MLAREMADQSVTAGVEEEAVSRILRRAGEIFSPSAPSIVRLECGRDGMVWVQRFAPDNHPLGYGKEWLIIDPIAKVAATVSLPPGFIPHDFSRETLIGVLIDEDDLQWTAIVPIPELTWAPMAALNQPL